MRNLMKVAVLSCGMLLWVGTSFAQTEFMKIATNPIFEGHQSNYDGQYAAFPQVILEGDLYHMYYSGCFESESATNGETAIDWVDGSKFYSADLRAGPGGCIAYAYSEDGLKWTINKLNPVLRVGETGSWDDGGIGTPTIIYDGEMWHMWYAGYSVNSSNEPKSGGIGYAYSFDGVRWSKFAHNPVMKTGANGSWEGDMIYPSTVLYDNNKGKYQMWYMGYGESPFMDGPFKVNIYRIGYAESEDGIHWKKDFNNPIVLRSHSIELNQVQQLFPKVTMIDGNYAMYYSASDKLDLSGSTINFALSKNGISNWVVNSKTILNPCCNDGWDNRAVFVSSVITNGNQFRLWYTGLSKYSNTSRIGYAEDFCAIPHTTQIIANSKYLTPKYGILKLKANVESCNSGNLNVQAIIKSDNGVIEKAINLVSISSTGIYSGSLSVPKYESTYTVCIVTTDLDHGYKHTTSDWNCDIKFTNAGPLGVFGFYFTADDRIPNPGDDIGLKVQVCNPSYTATIPNVTIKLIPEIDDGAKYYEDGGFGDIHPYRFSEGNGMLLHINSNVKAGTVLKYTVKIMSDGVEYWEDQIQFKVVKKDGDSNEVSSNPKSFSLKQNHPNPFNPSTTINYAIQSASDVSIKVYDILGNEVATLVNEYKSPGTYETVFDGSNLASGIYIYRIEAGAFTDSKKFTLLK